jgi:hypothetical protein
VLHPTSCLLQDADPFGFANSDDYLDVRSHLLALASMDRGVCLLILVRGWQLLVQLEDDLRKEAARQLQQEGSRLPCCLANNLDLNVACAASEMDAALEALESLQLADDIAAADQV